MHCSIITRFTKLTLNIENTMKIRKEVPVLCLKHTELVLETEVCIISIKSSTNQSSLGYFVLPFYSSTMFKQLKNQLHKKKYYKDHKDNEQSNSKYLSFDNTSYVIFYSTSLAKAKLLKLHDEKVLYKE